MRIQARGCFAAAQDRELESSAAGRIASSRRSMAAMGRRRPPWPVLRGRSPVLHLISGEHLSLQRRRKEICPHAVGVGVARSLEREERRNEWWRG
jgi:hypothetical protein